MLCYCCPPPEEQVMTIQLTHPQNGEVTEYAEIQEDPVEEFPANQIGYLAVTHEVYDTYEKYRQWVATRVSHHPQYATTQDPVLMTVNMNDWSLLIGSAIVTAKYTPEYITEPCSHSATGFVMVGIGVLGDVNWIKDMFSDQ